MLILLFNMFRSCVVLFTVISVQYVYSELSEKLAVGSGDYGPYEVVYNHYEVCKGPKQKNAAISQCTIEKNSKNEYIGQINLTMLEQCNLGEIRIVVSAVKNTQRTVLFNYRLTKPCEHFAFATPIQLYLHADKSNNCLIKKESFSLTLNFTEYVKLLLGKSFYYGHYIFKVIVSSSKGNILCLLFNTNFNKM